MGQPAQVYSPGGHGYGPGLRYHCLSATCAYASGCSGFFACIGNFESPHHFLKWWITFRLCPLSLMLTATFINFISVFFMVTSELHHLSHFLICHCQPPFLMATSGTLRDNMSSITLGGSGRKWYATKLVCFLIFLFFFFCHLPLLQPSLCTHTLPSLLMDTATFSLEGLPGPTNLTTMMMVMHDDTDMPPPHLVLALACAALLSSSWAFITHTVLLSPL